jgi:hypothetical protein
VTLRVGTPQRDAPLDFPEHLCGVVAEGSCRDWVEHLREQRDANLELDGELDRRVVVRTSSQIPPSTCSNVMR